MPEPLRIVDLPAGTPLERLLREEASRGGRVVVVHTAIWAPPCRALRKALADPSVAALLAGSCLVFVDIDRAQKELEALGMKVVGVPELCAWEPERRELGRLSGNAWGQDTVQNIAAALARWLPQLPAPPPAKAEPPPGRRKVLGLLGVLVGLGLLVAAAVWQVRSQEKASREQADQEMRERIRKDVAESVRKAMEKRGEAPSR